MMLSAMLKKAECVTVSPVIFRLLVFGLLCFNAILFMYMAVPNVKPGDTSPSQASIITIETRASQTQLQSTSIDSTSREEGFRTQPSRRAHQHVYYLKTHKTGSTTMHSIFAEYSRVHDLLPLLPTGHHINLRPPFHRSQLFLARDETNNVIKQKYDMVFNHAIYSREIFDYLHADTVKITTIRDPFRQFISSFEYFGKELNYLKRISNTTDPLIEFLKNRNKYEAKGFTSYTNNRQVMDLGFDIKHSFNDTSYTKQFIQETAKRFDLILITDYFNHSLVIMKRCLRWATQDILYFTKLARNEKKRSSEAETILYRELHASFSQADTALYNHFLLIFKERMKSEEGLDEEVAEFEAILEKVRIFCQNVTRLGSVLHIPAGKWSDGVDLLPYKCKWLKTDEVSFTTSLKKRQKDVLSFQ